jgi:hypothetical protein
VHKGTILRDCRQIGWIRIMCKVAIIVVSVKEVGTVGGKVGGREKGKEKKGKRKEEK